MHTPYDFKLDKECKSMLDKAVSDANTILQSFPRGEMGLTPDAVKATPEWQTAKEDYDRKFKSLRSF